MRGSAIARSANALVQANAQHAVYSNGIQAVNLPSNTPAAQVAISLKAGSANETASNLGAATFTRYCLGLSNYQNTGLLQQRMVNYMGGKFETMGTRERTIISISAGPKAIEELAMDVLVPSLLSPMFFKYEMFFPWDQAKRAAKCPVDNAFHEASFSGGLSNKLGFTGGYGSENPRMLEERDEILEDLGRNFHYNHYGTSEAVVVGSGVSDDFLEKLVTALDASPYANQAGPASDFNAGQVRIAKAGASKAICGLNVTGADAGAAAAVAAALGGKVLNYSGVQVIQFSAGSAAQLESKIAGLSNVNAEDAIASASLQQALLLGQGTSSAIQAVATGAVQDLSGVDAGSVASLAASLQNSAKSLVVVGDVHAFPQNSQI